MNRTIQSAVLATLLSFGFCSGANADFPTLAQRLPAASNAIVAVNVEKIVASPYGKSAEWGQRLAESWGKQPMMIPPGAKRLLMAADVKQSSLESNWELSLIEMTKVPTVEALANAEGGHVDRVFDKDAVYSPINAYFVPLEGNVLASITPAERSAIARWVRQPLTPGSNVTSAYIKDAVAKLSAQTDIVMAMDLEGAYGEAAIRKWLSNSEIPEIKPSDINVLAAVLGTMNGITLEVRVDDKINGKATVAFDRESNALRDTAKPIMLALLTQAGMKIDELPEWTFATSGKTITMEGKLSDVSLRRLLSIVQSPIPAATEMEQGGQSGGAQVATDPAVASQRYFKSITAIFQNAGAGASASATATWIRTASKRIDQLPILNVDPALVEWGTMASSKLKQAASILAVGQTQTNARVAGVMSSGYSYSDYDTASANSANRVANDNVNRQRRQAALEQRAQAQEQAAAVINELAESRSRMRAEMVAKYKVEF